VLQTVLQPGTQSWSCGVHKLSTEYCTALRPPYLRYPSSRVEMAKIETFQSLQRQSVAHRWGHLPRSWSPLQPHVDILHPLEVDRRLMEQFNGLRIVDMEHLVRLREGVRREESESTVETRSRRSSRTRRGQGLRSPKSTERPRVSQAPKPYSAFGSQGPLKCNFWSPSLSSVVPSAVLPRGHPEGKNPAHKPCSKTPRPHPSFSSLV
jgi:hypothetical protein